MNKSVWYFLFIFFGFFIALSIMFILTGGLMGKKVAPQPTNQATQSAQVTPEVAGAIVDLVKKDLHTATQADPTTITIISKTAIDWPDSSLGCPKAGFMYSQVITPGYKIIAKVGSEQFEYHTNIKDDVILCSTTQLDQSDQ